MTCGAWDACIRPECDVATLVVIRGIGFEGLASDLFSRFARNHTNRVKSYESFFLLRGDLPFPHPLRLPRLAGESNLEEGDDSGDDSGLIFRMGGRRHFRAW